MYGEGGGDLWLFIIDKPEYLLISVFVLNKLRRCFNYVLNWISTFLLNRSLYFVSKNKVFSLFCVRQQIHINANTNMPQPDVI